MISKKDIHHLSELARIYVSDHESEKLAEDLEAILGYVDTLKKLDIKSAEEIPLFSYLPSNMRNDTEGKKETKTVSEKSVELVNAAAEKENGYIRVKGVLEK